jgi:hypothetical protein
LTEDDERAQALALAQAQAHAAIVPAYSAQDGVNYPPYESQGQPRQEDGGPYGERKPKAGEQSTADGPQPYYPPGKSAMDLSVVDGGLATPYAGEHAPYEGSGTPYVPPARFDDAPPDL